MLHSIVQLSLLPQGSKDEALDVLVTAGGGELRLEESRAAHRLPNLGPAPLSNPPPSAVRVSELRLGVVCVCVYTHAPTCAPAGASRGEFKGRRLTQTQK